MSTTLTFQTGLAIADLDNATAANRKLTMTWTGGLRAFVTISNQSDDVVSLRSDTTAAAGGVVLPAGTVMRFGPYAASQNLYLYGLGAGSAYYAFDAVFSEVP
jgi:hypothetical protein